MGNKYYTPSIEEFRIGFEYEQLDLDSIYTKHIVNTKTSLEFLEDHSDELRVKYLDREDIESFGFTLIKKYSDELIFQINDGEYCFYELTFDKDNDNKINIEQWNQSKMVAKKLPKDQWTCFNIFSGIVKNKSELQQVLKMVGVIE